MSDERQFSVVATMTVTATFRVYAEDAVEAQEQVELVVNAYGVSVTDAYKFDVDGWDVSSVEEISA